MSNQQRFTGQSVLITGASTGIGCATALAFGAEGALVTIGDLDPRNERTAQAITETGGTASFVHADVIEPDSVADLVQQAVSQYGRLDVAFK